VPQNERYTQDTKGGLPFSAHMLAFVRHLNATLANATHLLRHLLERDTRERYTLT